MDAVLSTNPGLVCYALGAVTVWLTQLLPAVRRAVRGPREGGADEHG